MKRCSCSNNVFHPAARVHVHHDDLYLDKEEIGKLMPASVIISHSCLEQHGTSRGAALGLLDQDSTYLSLIPL